jgi:hypothetical protein
MDVLNKNVNHIQLIENLRTYLLANLEKEHKKFQLYESLDKVENLIHEIKDIKKQLKLNIEPNVPVDLILEIETEEANEEKVKEKVFYYTFFLAISIDKFPDTLEKRVSFYQYYLSRIISSKRLEIILISPFYTSEIGLIFLKENGLKENGIGYWQFTDQGKEPRIISKSSPLRSIMKNEYRTKKPKDAALFFDKYVHNAVNAVVGVKIEDFGKRFIEDKSYSPIYDLSSISYHEDLKSLVSEHLTDKNDDYEFVNETFTHLWRKHTGIFYPMLLKEYEPSLQNIFADVGSEKDKIYRDHYLHQFQVFLLGLPIIDRYYDLFKKYEKPELIWLIASSAHDIGYPIQLYDDYSEKFFKKFLNISRNPKIVELELKSKFIEDDFLSYTGYIVCELCSKHLNRPELKSNWLAQENDLIKFFFNEIAVKKNHALISSVSLLKLINEQENIEKIQKTMGNYKKANSNIFLPAILAIALHGVPTWPTAFKKFCNDKKMLMEKPCLRFEDDPISFLLVLCDSVQEWGRPQRNQKLERNEEGKGFYLKDFKMTDHSVSITLKTDHFSKGDKKFDDKDQELTGLKNLLRPCESLSFVIYLENRTGETKEYQLKGQSKKEV